jgi:hypothetical protein
MLRFYMAAGLDARPTSLAQIHGRESRPSFFSLSR